MLFWLLHAEHLINFASLGFESRVCCIFTPSTFTMMDDPVTILCSFPAIHLVMLFPYVPGCRPQRSHLVPTMARHCWWRSARTVTVTTLTRCIHGAGVSAWVSKTRKHCKRTHCLLSLVDPLPTITFLVVSPVYRVSWTAGAWQPRGCDFS